MGTMIDGPSGPAETEPEDWGAVAAPLGIALTSKAWADSGLSSQEWIDLHPAEPGGVPTMRYTHPQPDGTVLYSPVPGEQEHNAAVAEMEEFNQRGRMADDVPEDYSARLRQAAVGPGATRLRQVADRLKAERRETVDHPRHYGGKDNPYEAIKVIEAWSLGFCLGNTVKYIARAEHKGATIEDLKKAAWYLNREILARENADKKEHGDGR